MKKFVKLLSLPILALALAACGNNNPAPETTTAAPETTTVAPETTVVQVSTPNDTTVADESTTAEGETSEVSTSEVAATDVPFKFYVHGELVKEFVAKGAVDGSILDAMNSIEELEFTFDEAEGFIPTILGHDNNYDSGETWVYLLNGQYAELGVVSQHLAEGDVVEWYFGTTDELPVNIVQ